jgi:hypothetical protein
MQQGGRVARDWQAAAMLRISCARVRCTRSQSSVIPVRVRPMQPPTLHKLLLDKAVALVDRSHIIATIDVRPSGGAPFRLHIADDVDSIHTASNQTFARLGTEQVQPNMRHSAGKSQRSCHRAICGTLYQKKRAFLPSFQHTPQPQHTSHAGPVYNTCRVYLSERCPALALAHAPVCTPDCHP